MDDSRIEAPVDRDLLTEVSRLDSRYNRLVLVGEVAWVEGIMKLLHRLRVGEIGLWSPPVATGRPGQVLRILARPLSRDRPCDN
ncbi:MAG: hypothetical protein MH825_03325 [Cyanobacteria bacterium]|nr:hypothetical protein [Cyanobacteriota bacterium]